MRAAWEDCLSLGKVLEPHSLPVLGRTHGVSSRNPAHLTVGQSRKEHAPPDQGQLARGAIPLRLALPPEFSLLLSKSCPVGFKGMALGFPCGTPGAGEREDSIFSPRKAKACRELEMANRRGYPPPCGPEAWSDTSILQGVHRDHWLVGPLVDLFLHSKWTRGDILFKNKLSLPSLHPNSRNDNTPNTDWRNDSGSALATKCPTSCMLGLLATARGLLALWLHGPGLRGRVLVSEAGLQQAQLWLPCQGPTGPWASWHCPSLGQKTGGGCLFLA